MTGDSIPTSDRPPVVVITGPTASGKSGLALLLAEAVGGVVINADSMQVYRELAVLTARPGAEALDRAPHRLYGVLPGSERCSAGGWRKMALEEIAACHAAGQVPLVVGGTGLYLRALERGLAKVPEIAPEIRQAARARHRDLGGAVFHAELAVRDPVMAARLSPGDSQRLIRAWEVVEATGRSLAAWQAEEGAEPPAPYRFLRITCQPPRKELYAACNARFAAMAEGGALEEVRALLALALDPSLPIMKALGVPELAAHLAGEFTLDQAVFRAQQATRNYAKRQMTWLRTQGAKDRSGEAIQIAQYLESLEPKIFTIIRHFLLTG